MTFFFQNFCQQIFVNNKKVQNFPADIISSNTVIQMIHQYTNQKKRTKLLPSNQIQARPASTTNQKAIVNHFMWKDIQKKLIYILVNWTEKGLKDGLNQIFGHWIRNRTCLEIILPNLKVPSGYPSTHKMELIWFGSLFMTKIFNNFQSPYPTTVSSR